MSYTENFGIQKKESMMEYVNKNGAVRLVEDDASLAEKQLIDEYDLDDRVIELAKILIIPELNQMQQDEFYTKDDEVVSLFFTDFIEAIEATEEGETGCDLKMQFESISKDGTRGRVLIDCAIYFDVEEDFYLFGLENGIQLDDTIVNQIWAEQFMEKWVENQSLNSKFS